MGKTLFTTSEKDKSYGMKSPPFSTEELNWLGEGAKHLIRDRKEETGSTWRENLES